MKTLVLTLFALVISISAQASHFEHCEFDAEVVSVKGKVPTLNKGSAVNNKHNTFSALLAFKITAAKKLPGSYISCQSFIEKNQVLIINDSAAKDYKAGDNLKLEYTMGNNLTADGVLYDILWSEHIAGEKN